MKRTSRILAVAAAVLLCLSGLAALVGGPGRRRAPARPVPQDPASSAFATEEAALRKYYSATEQKSLQEFRRAKEREWALQQKQQRPGAGTENRPEALELTPLKHQDPSGKQRP